MSKIIVWTIFFCLGLEAISSPSESAPAVVCDSSTYGGLFYDSGSTSMYLCNPSGWGGMGGWLFVGTSIYPSNLSTKVGIGTSTPATTLDVNGGVRPGSVPAASIGTACSPLGAQGYNATTGEPVYCNSSSVWASSAGGTTYGNSGGIFWKKEANGLITQWGRGTANVSNISFPIPFTNLASISINCTAINWPGAGRPDGASNVSINGFTPTNPGGNDPITWTAIGY